jgi:hypothetical protein
MRVLFFVEPLTEIERPAWKIHWINYVAKMIATLRREFTTTRFTCLVGDGLEDVARTTLHNCDIAVIRHTELVPRFGDSALAVATTWYRSPASQSVRDMADLVSCRAGGFAPDACITMSSAPFLAIAFPNVPVLHFELGMISREPFPTTAYLDPEGMFCNAYPALHSESLKNFQPPEREVEVTNTLRRNFLSLIAEENPLTDRLKAALEGFESSTLLALQFPRFVGYDAHATFAEQYDLLIQTLEAASGSCAVVAVEHPQHPQLTDETVSYLRSRYRNFIWLPEFRRIPSASQYLIEHVDSVVTVSSSVGLQSMLWKKPLLVPGHSHLDIIADSHSLSDLPQLANLAWPTYKENYLAWRLCHYDIPFSLLFDEGILAERIRMAQSCALGADHSSYFSPPFTDVSAIRHAYSRDNIIAPLRARIATLEKQVADLDNELHETTSSSSWKITRPLRTARDWLFKWH